MDANGRKEERTETAIESKEEGNMKIIDLRSDTVTQPTEEMRRAMAAAPVGDDVYEDDPTVKKLEEEAARLLGKEAALFVPSGTFANQLALFTHCTRGDEVILPHDAHIVMHEVGAASVIAGVQLRTVRAPHGVMNPEDIKALIRDKGDIHYPHTGLICMENAYSDGSVLSPEAMRRVYETAKEHELPVHLDGARIFNAAIALGVEASEIAKYTDSLMFCLSKGLCSPVGSLLLGTREFVARARKKRKLMGGGMRQVGILAAAGLISIREMRLRLHEDHENAKYLAKELDAVPGIEVEKGGLDINMVFFKVTNPRLAEKMTEEFFLAHGVKINPQEEGLFRFVTHHGVTKEDVSRVVGLIRSL